jgi:uncharacterized protein YecA (UPF0149 family)
MAALGSKKRPICVRLTAKAQLDVIAEICNQLGFEFIAELAPDGAPDFTDLERAMEGIRQRLAPPVVRIGRNDPCPCASGRKSKKCCASSVTAS